MDDKFNVVMGLVFLAAACLFGAGTVNQWISTHEISVFSIVLSLIGVGGAFVFLRKK